MARTLKSDRALFLATVFLVAASVVMVYSASAVQAMDRFQAPSHFLYKQVAWAIVGFGLMVAAMRTDYHRYRRPAVIWTLLGVTFVMLLAVFLWPKINGTQRWLAFRFFSLQPSELAKLAAILFTAALLDRRMHRIGDVSYALLPVILVTMGLAGLVVLEPDFGTSVAIVLVVTAMLFAAGLRVSHLVTAGLVLLPTAAGLVFSSSYRRRRFLAFLDPWSVQSTEGFQIIQSLLAIGSGGVFGKGLMGGIQKLYYLPEAHTDFIFSVIAEELGLVGTTVTLLCFALIAWRGLRASLLAPDRFGSLLALGVTMMITLQALLNITVVTALAPTKGLPLPFVSNGGSSLVVNMVAMGVLLNISQQASPTAAAALGRGSAWALDRQEA